MISSSQGHVTQLLQAYGAGEHEALERLMPLLYDELHALAGRHMAGERRSHTLSTTELVHEAYLNLVDQTQVGPQNRRHFFAIASRVMRNLLIDYARRHAAQKRGGGQRPTSLDGKAIAVQERADELLALDAALDRLAARDERMARVVQYRFFGGLTLKETAHLLDVSVMTVHRDWKRAKAWLYDDLDPV
jgi:RNA polymerase sigma factor (TIGR02999 family)